MKFPAPHGTLAGERRVDERLRRPDGRCVGGRRLRGSWTVSPWRSRALLLGKASVVLGAFAPGAGRPPPGAAI